MVNSVWLAEEERIRRSQAKMQMGRKSCFDGINAIERRSMEGL